MAAQGDHVDCTKVLLDHRAPVDDVTVVCYYKMPSMIQNNY